MLYVSASLVFPGGSTFSLFKSSTSSNCSYRWLGFLHNAGWDNACFNLRQSGVCSDRNKKIEVCCVGLSQQLFFIYTTLLCVRPKIASVQTPLSRWLFFTYCSRFSWRSHNWVHSWNWSNVILVSGFSHTSLISAWHSCTRLLLSEA